jgi:hypothetical protein
VTFSLSPEQQRLLDDARRLAREAAGLDPTLGDFRARR